MVRFTLYSRSYCHLCEDMHQALKQALQAQGIDSYQVDVVDVDADEALLEQYDELVPVLVGYLPNGEVEKICHYFLNAENLHTFLRGWGSTVNIVGASSHNSII